MFERLRYHARYLSYALGAQRMLGGRRWRMQGYFPDKFCLNAAHEPHMVGLIETLLRARRGTFIDIGVNLGQTLVKVLGVDRERDYVGFEPQIACCFHVDQFIRRNAVAHARVIPGIGGRHRVARRRGHTAIDPALAQANRERAQQLMALFAGHRYGVHQIDTRGTTAPIGSFALDDRQACPSMEYLALPDSSPVRTKAL